MLEKINSPADIKALHIDELERLADEIRSEIIKTTLHNGGHLASNLGTVELTLAIHYVFDAPEDKLIFDVGHQCYTHKLITGRHDRFSTLRRQNGISGFPSHTESEYDTFDAGHSSTAISAALGLARARDRKGEDYHVIAIVGDGAMGGGMAFEAINDAGASRETKLIIILNDNEMSISKNVGALSGHFSKLRTTKGYLRSKKNVRKALEKINHSGKLFNVVAHLRNTLRYFLIGETIFDAMGLKYLGPINGHSLKDMIDILRRAKEQPGPVVIHAVTCKGCGYAKAEENPEIYHGVSCGKGDGLEKISYAKQLSDTLCRLAQDNDDVCAVTAGMTYNTGLAEFAQKFPQRFFDTGIAEQHALGMAGGLAKGGMHPYVVIYSTFLQRGFDQVFHDICLQELPVTLCIDHAGLVGEDGPTHNGVFDIGFLRSMPGLILLAPRDTEEFDRMLVYSLAEKRPVAIRYPKGCVENIEGAHPFNGIGWDELLEGEAGTVLTFGACISEGMQIARTLGWKLIDTRTLKPLDTQCLEKIKDAPICVIEDNAPQGGLFEAVLHYYHENGIAVKIKGFALEDAFTAVGSVEQQRESNHMDTEYILEQLKQL